MARGLLIAIAIGTVALVLGLFLAGSAGVGVPGLGALSEAAGPRAAAAPESSASSPALENVLETRLAALRTASLSPGDQGILVETPDGEVLMAHNTSMPINPASVLKLAPTLMALERFGPTHRFRTAFLADGVVSNGVLDGSLGVLSDGDPTFGRERTNAVADALRAHGIREVSGDLVVAGPFSFHTTDETPDAADRFRESLVRAGLRVRGGARIADNVTGTEVAAVESVPLLEIVQRQNAHSVNRTADNLGTTVGGPAAVQRYLVETVGVSPSEVTVTHTSGLGHNAISARGVMRLLRALYAEAERDHIALDRIIPLNGVDEGTMRRRLVSDGLAGTVAAKTGTHYTEDGGVAALCGVAYTRAKGPLFFVILNSHGPVGDYRKWQDKLLADVIDALGSQPLARATEVASEQRAAAGRDPFASKASRPARAD